MSESHPLPAGAEPIARPQNVASRPELTSERGWVLAAQNARGGATAAPGSALWRQALFSQLPRARGLVHRTLSRQGIAQVQGAFYALSGVWSMALMSKEAMVLTVSAPLILQILAGAMLLKLAHRRNPSDAAAYLGIIAAAAQLSWHVIALGDATLGLSFGIHMMVQMACVGWWAACLGERSPQHHVDTSLQPRPGRPLYR